MRFVYGTGESHNLDFAIADRRDGVPSGAKVYATCSDEQTAHQLGEQSFNQLTDEEYFALQEFINQAEQAESSGAHVVTHPDAGLLRRLLRRITALLF